MEAGDTRGRSELRGTFLPCGVSIVCGECGDMHSNETRLSLC